MPGKLAGIIGQKKQGRFTPADIPHAATGKPLLHQHLLQLQRQLRAVVFGYCFFCFYFNAQGNCQVAFPFFNDGCGFAAFENRVTGLVKGVVAVRCLPVDLRLAIVAGDDAPYQMLVDALDAAQAAELSDVKVLAAQEVGQ